MSGLRDYERWHRRYDDPASDLSWRMRTVQRHIRQALDERAGPIRIASACAGDGRDVLGVLAERPDSDRVSGTLIELHPDIAARARRVAAEVDADIVVRSLDAGFTDAYIEAVPADLVLLVGIFGNISDHDLFRTIEAAPMFCAPGATLLWSRGRKARDLNDEIRARFNAVGFTELDYATAEFGDCPAVGATRYTGSLAPLIPGQHLFTFMR